MRFQETKNRGNFTFVRIREYEPRDAGAVVRLAEMYASWDATPTLADIQGFHAQNPDLFFVAESGDDVVGFVYGFESKLPPETLLKWKTNKVGSLETLTVAEQHRRKRVATSLLVRLFETFKQKGIDTVTVSVPAQEIGARRLYDKMGFETRGYFLRKKL